MSNLSLRAVNIETSKIQGYERGGFNLTTSPIPEYLKLEAMVLTDNQTAFFATEFDFTLDYLACKFAGTEGTITVTLTKDGDDIWTNSYAGNLVAAGLALPSFPIKYEGLQLKVTTTKACDFLWVSIKQCAIIETFPPIKII